MNPLISIIVPVYKVEKYLYECVQSIINQTYKNLEIILVDDGSPDNCPQICDQWAEKDDRIKVIHQENKGLAETREIGISKATGEYLCFVDSDDYIDINLCKLVLDVFAENDVDIVVFDCCKVSEKGVILSSTENINKEILTSKKALEKLVEGNINNYFCNKVYKRRVFNNIDYCRQRFWEDMGAMYQIFLNAKKIYCLPEKMYYYRMRRGSIINSVSDKALQDIFYILYRRYRDLYKIYPEVAELGFSRIAWSAIRLYDRSLWGNIDENSLQDALAFLESNKDKILKLEDKNRFVWFYRNRWVYNSFRLFKHGVGNIVRKIKK